MTHICVNEPTIIGSDNGLLPGCCQAIIWTNAEILLIGPLGTNFSEILIEIYTFSFKKMHMKMLSGKWWPSCHGLNVSKKSGTYLFLTSISYCQYHGGWCTDDTRSHGIHIVYPKLPIIHMMPLCVNILAYQLVRLPVRALQPTVSPQPFCVKLDVTPNQPINPDQ